MTVTSLQRIQHLSMSLLEALSMQEIPELVVYMC